MAYDALALSSTASLFFFLFHQRLTRRLCLSYLLLRLPHSLLSHRLGFHLHLLLRLRSCLLFLSHRVCEILFLVLVWFTLWSYVLWPRWLRIRNHRFRRRLRRLRRRLRVVSLRLLSVRNGKRVIVHGLFLMLLLKKVCFSVWFLRKKKIWKKKVVYFSFLA